MSATLPEGLSQPPGEGVSLDEVRAEVLALADDAPEGGELPVEVARIIEFVVRACGTTLDLAGAQERLEVALDADVTPEQIQEALILVSGIGIHGLIGTAGLVADTLKRRSLAGFDGDLTVAQQAALEEAGGGGARESRISAVAPEFLPNLVRLSPEATVRAVLEYRAAPWQGTALSEVERELIGIAVDAMPSHRFLPTLRMHVRRALDLGVGIRQLTAVLDIAAAAPPHRGVR